MSEVLELQTPQTPLVRGAETQLPVVAVVGLGYVGLPVAVAFGRQHPTIGYDLSKKRVENLRHRVDTTGEVSGAELAEARHWHPTADPAESPNADIVNAFLNRKDGRTFQSVPVAVFLTRGFEALYTYFEFPAIYHKVRLSDAMQVARPGESREQAWERFDFIVSPTAPGVAFELGAKTADPLAMYLNDFCTVPMSLAGTPVISIPNGLADGLPVGFQIAGPAFSETRILDAAYALERAIGFEGVPVA